MSEAETELLLHVAIRIDENDILRGASFSTTRSGLESKLARSQQSKTTSSSIPDISAGFQRAITDFRTAVGGYRRASNIYGTLRPLITSTHGSQAILEPAKSVGKFQGHLLKHQYYTIPYRYSDQILSAFMATTELSAFQSTLRETFLIGLISVYDGYIYEMLECVFRARPALLEASNRNISYKQLLEFSSLESAQAHVINKEIDSITHESRIKQIEWMSKSLGVNIDFSDPIWNPFFEICERRNALTHAGGRATQTYIDNCRSKGIEIGNTQLGDTLNVTSSYLRHAIDIFYEVGIKLGIITWRHLISSERHQAEDLILNVGYRLIKQKRYKLARRIMEFAIKMPKWSTDKTRRMCVVNLANACKLSGDEKEALLHLNAYDWSASSVDFTISVAAVRGDVQSVVDLMTRIGQSDSLPRDAYYDWPVFDTVRDAPEFREAFKEVFGMSFDDYSIEQRASSTPPEDLQIVEQPGVVIDNIVETSSPATTA